MDTFYTRSKIEEIITSLSFLSTVIKRCIEYIIVSIKYPQKDIINVKSYPTGETSDHNYPIFLSDDLLILNNIPSDIPGAVAVKFTDGSYGIFINNALTQRSTSFQKAAISHEEGHIVNTHLEELDPKDQLFEHEADLFALDNGYDIISVLKTLHSEFRINTADRVSLIQRIIINRKGANYA